MVRLLRIVLGCGNGLCFPVEGCEFRSGLRVFPGRFAHGVDDERSAYHYHAADDQYGEPYRVAADRDLAGRNEAEDEGEQCSEEADRADRPHQTVAFLAQSERTCRIFHLVAQHDRRREHQHVHDQVEQYGELREDLVERLYRRHYDEQQRQKRYYAALDEQDIALYAVLVAFL